MKKVSVVIPCLNEVNFIDESIASVLRQDFPIEQLEVFFVDGGSTDGTRQILEEVAEKHPHIFLLDNPNRTVPFALNAGIRNATGDFVLRLDVHSSFPESYISKLMDWHTYLDADNLGGICFTDVQRKNPISEAIKLVMSDQFGVGNSTFRVGSNKLLEVDTVPFGCYKRDVFERIGYFDERLTRNQDIEFNKRLKRNGGTILLVPDVTCTYFARDTFGLLFANRFKTGMWIVKTSCLTKSFKNLSVRHFIPFAFVAGLLGSLGLSLFWNGFLILFFLIFGSYVFLMAKRAIKITNENTKWYLVFIAFFVLHFSYGLGSLRGFQFLPLYFKDNKKKSSYFVRKK
jgi:glycosyltransferase involved in cell wall biosynthesis